MRRSFANSPPQVIRRSAQFDTLVLNEVVYPAGLKIGWHSHELAAFALTLRGSSTEAFRDSRFDRTEAGLLLRPAGERHWDSIGEQGAKCFVLELKAGWIDDLPQVRTVLLRPSFHRLGILTILAQRAYSEWLQEDSASQIAIPALALEMAAHLMRESEPRKTGQPPSWLRRVRQRLDDGFADTPTTLAELAGISGVHRTHLVRNFRRHYGVSIGEYLRRRRVDAACAMLTKPGVSLTEIALATGFANHAHFATVFKRITGFTPSDFRRSRRS
jgi:AraC family transcriptional regulator